MLSWDGFVNWTLALQEGYKAALATGSEAAISAALEPADMVQVHACMQGNLGDVALRILAELQQCMAGKSCCR
jgi:hypothetical protein